MSRLDIIAFEALDADQHMVRVDNAAFLAFVRTRLAPHLPEDKVALYDKLLRSDRARYTVSDRMDVSLDETYMGRYARYRERTASLARACVDALLAQAPECPEIRAVVANTTVGGMVPNLSSIIGCHVGLAPDARVIDLGYMGCAAALLGLELIEQQLRPGEAGIVLSSELTSVMSNLLADSDASLVANTVFGDGVGAFLVARRPHRFKPLLRLAGHAGSIQTDKDALAAITYEANPVYHEIRLHNTIPAVAGRGVRTVMEHLVRHHLATPSQKLIYLLRRKTPAWQRQVDYAVLHTAGRSVLQELVGALRLDDAQVAHNFRAFDRYGNTSSASLYYALKELMRGETLRRGQRILLLGYGSGFFTRGCVAEVA